MSGSWKRCLQLLAHTSVWAFSLKAMGRADELRESLSVQTELVVSLIPKIPAVVFLDCDSGAGTGAK